jgi:hypothetical protein
MRVFAYAEREDLVPFLPTQQAGGGGAGGLKKITLPSVWGYSQATLLARPMDDGTWTVVGVPTRPPRPLRRPSFL